MRARFAITLLFSAAVPSFGQTTEDLALLRTTFDNAGYFTVRQGRELYCRGWAGLTQAGGGTDLTQLTARSRPAEKRADGGWNFVGWLGPKEAPLASYSQACVVARETLGLAYQFQVLRDFEAETLHVSFLLPARRFAGKRLLLDAHETKLPAQTGTVRQRVSTARPQVVTASSGVAGQISLRFDRPQVLWIEQRPSPAGAEFELKLVLGAGRLQAGQRFDLAVQCVLPALTDVAVGEGGGERQTARRNWLRFDLPWNDSAIADADKRTATDASALLHTPAGERGFLQVKDGHFAWPNGARQRFWGVAMPIEAVPDSNEAGAVAARLAKFGVNLVCIRLGGPGDASAAQGESEQIANFDAFFDKLAQRGIYTQLVLVGEHIGSGLFINEQSREMVQRRAAAWLLRKNPASGKPYIEHPALALVQIANSDSLFLYPESASNSDAAILEKAWRDHAGPQAPPLTACVPRLYGSGAAVWTARATRFLAERERDFYARLRTHLRGLGLKCPILASSTAYGMAETWAQATVCDALAIGANWDEPLQGVAGGPQPGAMRALWIEDRPMIRGGGGYLRQFAAAAAAGKPLLVNSVMNCGPNRFRGEGPVLLAAHAAMQDWDGVIWGDFASRAGYAKHFDAQAPFDIVADPARFGQFAAASRIFLGGLVVPSRLHSQVAWSADDLTAVSAWTWSGSGPIADDLPPTWLTFTSRWRNRLPDVPAPDPDIAIAAARGTEAAALPAKAKFRLAQKSDEDRTQLERLWTAAAQKIGVPLGWESGGGRAYASDTGQLTWDQDRGRFIVRAPACRAAIGFIGGQAHTLGDATLDVTDPGFASVTLICLDGEPVSESRRLLLTTMARCENTGQRWLINIDGEVRATHIEPGVWLEPVRATITLHRRTPIKAWALDAAGQRLRELPVGRATDGYAFTVAGESMFYEIAADTKWRLWPFGGESRAAKQSSRIRVMVVCQAASARA
ncbi:MAG: hypothetical protein N2689_01550 [Verrucomicrobiae bacterium]|nr:hypothetical protein [Verrucomicrobiae bacterium]